MKKQAVGIKNVICAMSEKTKLSPRALIVVFLLVAGVAVLMLSEASDDTQSVQTLVSTTALPDYREYESELESRLTSIVSAIDGAGETRVMVTIESGSEEVYLNNSDYGENVDTDGDNSFEKKDEYVIVDGSSGEGGIIVRTNEPRIRGVAVVCEGAGVESVKLQIIDTVTALLDISSARVSVAKMD